MIPWRHFSLMEDVFDVIGAIGFMGHGFLDGADERDGVVSIFEL
ncbi:MAG: hypothetical protein Q8P64_06025 [Deltaproteobacteria bacterium]|nr:hypothetical protein [Deltaproteobacteria bacterium]